MLTVTPLSYIIMIGGDLHPTYGCLTFPLPVHLITFTDENWMRLLLLIRRLTAYNMLLRKLYH